jgi:NTE family protein
MEYPFRNLVFEGGGVKGIAYIGAMEVLDKKRILNNIKRVGGASAGAINALLFALGYSIEETRTILWQLDFDNFEDGSFWPINVLRIFNRYGWYKGEFFKNWIGDLIKKKTGSRHTTFAELSRLGMERGFREVSMIGTNLSTRFSEIYTADLTPEMQLADAVRISMSIPLFFKAVRDSREDVLADGGVLDNYPIKLFDRQKYLDPIDREKHSFIPPYYARANQVFRSELTSPYVYNKETLGFRLDTKEEIDVFKDHKPPVAHRITSFAEYAKGLIGTMLESQESQHLHSDDWQRTIYIDTLGVKTTDFDLGEQKKNELLKSGVTNTELYFKWYENPKNRPINRVVDRRKKDLATLRELRRKVSKKR